MPRISMTITIDQDVAGELAAFCKRLGQTGRGQQGRLIEQAIKNLIHGDVPLALVNRDGEEVYEQARGVVEQQARMGMHFTKELKAAMANEPNLRVLPGQDEQGAASDGRDGS